MHVGRECNLGTALGAFLCGYDDDAVRCARTVDGRSRGVFEDCHRLDVVGRNHCHRIGCAVAAVHRHAVDDDKGVVRCVERGAAADADVCAAAGSTAVSRDDNAGACADEEVVGRGGKTGFDFVGLDNGD